MKITFLGTGAATSYPLAFCKCENCEKARRMGGPDLRKRSSLLINQDLLIDLGPDVVAASFEYGISIAEVRYCLQTHPHSDHFDASHLSTRIAEYGTENLAELHLYASRAAFDRMSVMLKTEGYVSDILDPEDQARLKVNVRPVKAFESFTAGKYRISALATNHDSAAGSLLYAVAEGDSTIFYGTDTDVLPEESWQGLREMKLLFDIVVLDHTYGPGIDGDGHLNSDQFIEHIQRMRDENLLKQGARILATHISHEGNPTHAELVEYGREHRYEIAFDGLVVRTSDS